MEDALALNIKDTCRSLSAGLNPCFNGRCTRTANKFWEGKEIICLNPCFNGRCTRTR